MREILKRALLFAIIGCATAGIVRAAQVTLPYPINQCQIPAACIDLQNALGQVNANVVLGNGSALSVSQSTTSGPIVDGVTFTGGIAGSGGPAGIGQTFGVATVNTISTVDTNVDLSLNTQGSGLIKFADANFWVHEPTLYACPGASQRNYAGITAGPSPTISGFLLIKDELGKVHWMPAC